MLPEAAVLLKAARLGSLPCPPASSAMAQRMLHRLVLASRSCMILTIMLFSHVMAFMAVSPNKQSPGDSSGWQGGAAGL